MNKNPQAKNCKTNIEENDKPHLVTFPRETLMRLRQYDIERQASRVETEVKQDSFLKSFFKFFGISV